LERWVSLGDVLGLAAGTEVGSLLALVVGVNVDNTTVVLNALHGAAGDTLVSALGGGNLRCLVSNLTITSQ
jgi:isocitrate dehydrogenase